MHFSPVVKAQAECNNGVIASTSPITYPSIGNYPPNAFCNWRMEVAAGLRVKTTFSSVSIEPSTTPYNDFLLVFDGPTCTSAILAKITGSASPVVTSSDNNTSLMFISNGATQLTGFTASFASSKL
ncbi:hypothetical protein EG68_00539 [Paragonimus skrjabini miyazakii]|uniref:CUB domain-containing protein n=1 Tax=Paragonimus skrjabini miyazakii TaxID=59628 RepID=A0A8S9Z8N9_9TREM|nr:hypothetical protein EG68_00539 [Paragonimus skrjabini miyazakii]